MGNYVASCSGRRDGCCRDELKDFHNAKTFGKRRENIRDKKKRNISRQTTNHTNSLAESHVSTSGKSAQSYAQSPLEGSLISVESEYEPFGKKVNNKEEESDQEGISLYNYVVQTCGPTAPSNFSKDLDLRSIRLICLLGEGSFAKVFFVKKREITGEHKYYAMKVLDKSILKEKDYLNYIKLEKQILMTLEHPFILKLHYSFQCKANLYLMLDYEGGGSLFFHLKKQKRFTESEVAFYAAEIILALEYLHEKKIIYRDLKPENILLRQDGHIRLADFGLAKKLNGCTLHDVSQNQSKCIKHHIAAHYNRTGPESQERHSSGSTDLETNNAEQVSDNFHYDEPQTRRLGRTSSSDLRSNIRCNIENHLGVPMQMDRKYSELSNFNNIEAVQKWRGGSLSKAFSVCGTPQYMSPEVIAQKGHDMLSDWWSLGIVLYELATGVPPFRCEDLGKMAEDIRFEDLPTQSFFSDEFENLVMRLTSKMPSMRLGKNGAQEVKDHPFFRNINWDQVLAKQMKPPVVPQKKALCKLPKNEQTGEVNPYALLNCNFDSEYYDRDVVLWRQSPQDNMMQLSAETGQPQPESLCNLSNFTYDKLSPPALPTNKKGCTQQARLKGQTLLPYDNDLIEMGSLGGSIVEQQPPLGSIDNDNRSNHLEDQLRLHKQVSSSNDSASGLQTIKKVSLLDTNGQANKYYSVLRQTSILEEDEDENGENDTLPAFEQQPSVSVDKLDVESSLVDEGDQSQGNSFLMGGIDDPAPPLASPKASAQASLKSSAFGQ